MRQFQLPKTPSEPPTERQIAYAKLCGVDVSPDMNRQDVSQAINAAFAADPKLHFKIAARRKRAPTEQAEQAKIAEKEWADLMARLPASLKREYKKWEKAEENQDRLLVAYRTSRATIVDVLEVHFVDIDPDTNEITIHFGEPRVETIHAGYFGAQKIFQDELLWDQDLNLCSTDILESRKVELDASDIKKYVSMVERAIKRLQDRGTK